MKKFIIECPHEKKRDREKERKCFEANPNLGQPNLKLIGRKHRHKIKILKFYGILIQNTFRKLKDFRIVIN